MSTSEPLVVVQLKKVSTTPDPECWEIALNQTDTIQTLRQLIQEKTTVHPLHQLLVYKGRKIEDEEEEGTKIISQLLSPSPSPPVIHMIIRPCELLRLILQVQGRRKQKVVVYDRARVAVLQELLSPSLSSPCRLVFKGEVLEESMTLRHYKLKNKSRVIVEALG